MAVGRLHTVRVTSLGDLTSFKNSTTLHAVELDKRDSRKLEISYEREVFCAL
jgi:hypothetical protein